MGVKIFPQSEAPGEITGRRKGRPAKDARQSPLLAVVSSTRKISNGPMP